MAFDDGFNGEFLHLFPKLLTSQFVTACLAFGWNSSANNSPIVWLYWENNNELLTAFKCRRTDVACAIVFRNVLLDYVSGQNRRVLWSSFQKEDKGRRNHLVKR